MERPVQGKERGMNTKPLSIVLLSVFLVCSCTMPETKIYSLSVPVFKEQPGTGTGATVSIIVHAQRYLEQAYIVYRTSPYQLEIARYSKWDSSPAEIVRGAIKDSLSSMCAFRDVRSSNFTPAGAYALEINLRKFERSDIGGGSFAELAFDAVLFSPEGKELYNTYVSREVRLDDRSYLSLAKALSIAVAEGVGELRAGLSGAMAAGEKS